MDALTVTTYTADGGRSLREFLHPVRMARELWAHRDLTLQIARREAMGRYRSSRLGLLWSLITPLISLAVYTLVFSGILKARFTANPTESHASFVLYLFCGMLVYTVFAEVVGRSPTLITANPNFVKKVVFPLEVLVPAALLESLFRMGVGFGAWLLFWVGIEHDLPRLTVLLLPLVLLPMCLMTVGAAWLASSLGVFVRDLANGAGGMVQLLAFMTPVYYSIEQIPHPTLRFLMRMNPLAETLEQARRVTIQGMAPDWWWWLASLLMSGVFCLLGYAVFMKSKRGFADVL